MTDTAVSDGRDYSHLTPQLKGLEGWQVEAFTMDGERRTFIVGRSTGLFPLHLELKHKRSRSGYPALYEYQNVRKLKFVRRKRKA